MDELENVIMAIAVVKGLNPVTRDYLVSFGENVSKRIFSAYLNKLGKGKSQEWESYAVDTCGGGGTDLTATTIAREMGAREIQVWKDVDGVLTCDPTVCTNAVPLPCLTFDEAAELGLFNAQSMQLAMEGGISIKVKNSYNPQAPGTVITKTRDTSKSVLTSIVLRSNITVLNIERTRMVYQSDFLKESFKAFGKLGISVDCAAISEGKISLIVDPSQLSSHELVLLDLDKLVEELPKDSVVDRLKDRSVISLIGNAQMSAIILVKAFIVLQSINVEVQKFWQGSSKVLNISLVVDNDKGEDCVRALHSAFFEKGFVPEAQGADRELNGSPVQAPQSSDMAAARSGEKRKVDDDHPEAPPSVRQERADTDPIDPEETDRTTFPQNDPMPVGDGNGRALGESAFEGQPEQQGLAEVAEGSGGPGTALDKINDLLFSEDRMENGGDPDKWWAGLLEGEDNLDITGVLPVGGGEQAMPQSAPAAVTNVDAGHGSSTGHDFPKETEQQISSGKRLTLVDPGDVIIPEDFPGQFEVEEYTRRPIDLDVRLDLFGASEADPQQQVLADSGSTVEEMLEEISPNVLFS